MAESITLKDVYDEALRMQGQLRELVAFLGAAEAGPGNRGAAKVRRGSPASWRNPDQAAS